MPYNEAAGADPTCNCQLFFTIDSVEYKTRPFDLPESDHAIDDAMLYINTWIEDGSLVYNIDSENYTENDLANFIISSANVNTIIPYGEPGTFIIEGFTGNFDIIKTYIGEVEVTFDVPVIKHIG